MYLILGLAILAFTLGCQTAPIVCHSAPSPSAEAMVHLRDLQTRVVPGSFARGLPRVLSTLADQGYLVTAVNEQTGLVAFFQQWRDEAQGGALIRQEGSLMLKALGPESTQVRLLLTGSGQRREFTSLQKAGSTTGMISTVQQHAAPEDYRKLLDLVAEALSSQN